LRNGSERARGRFVEPVNARAGLGDRLQDGLTKTSAQLPIFGVSA
jgi:hypothetical protein